MDKLKDPALLLSIANSIGMVGTTAYFYKELESIRADMQKLSLTITGLVRKIGETDKNEQHKSEALHTLNDQIKRINEHLEDLPSPDTIDNLDWDLSEIINILEENEIFVDRPSQQQRGRRSGDRRSPAPRKYISESDTDDRRRMNTRRNRDDTREQDMRNRNRESQQQRISRESVPELGTAYDDENLIGEVRRQAIR